MEDFQTRLWNFRWAIWDEQKQELWCRRTAVLTPVSALVLFFSLVVEVV